MFAIDCRITVLEETWLIGISVSIATPIYERAVRGVASGCEFRRDLAIYLFAINRRITVLEETWLIGISVSIAIPIYERAVRGVASGYGRMVYGSRDIRNGSFDCGDKARSRVYQGRGVH